jgi:hypothetical protein
LFDLFETGFNFPPCTIVLDDLFSGQIEVGSGLETSGYFFSDLFIINYIAIQ